MSSAPAPSCCRWRSACSTPRARPAASSAQAKAIGADAERLCELLFAVEGRVGQRKLWGIVGLADRYPRRLVDRACAQAMHDGIHSYSHVKRLTEKLVADALAAIERAEEPRQQELALTQEHPLIRPADIYAELFSRCAAAQPSTPLDPWRYCA